MPDPLLTSNECLSAPHSMGFFAKTKKGKTSFLIPVGHGIKGGEGTLIRPPPPPCKHVFPMANQGREACLQGRV